MFYIYVRLLIVKKLYACYIPINAELVYLSRAVFALTAITHSSPQDFNTVHWNKIITWLVHLVGMAPRSGIQGTGD